MTEMKREVLPPYCASRYCAVRRVTREVRVGAVGVGAKNPIRIQSMTTSDTLDVAATVRQCVALAEVGCEIIRITAPNPAAARALKEIRAGFSAAGAGFKDIPLVADIHFIPAAAMEAVEHVEKVRINPGNYADKKRFGTHDYTDAEYAAELERVAEAFAPLVLRAKALGRSLRIGSNHGSLSDRVMNRYGDSPLGMVECALEFVRVCERLDFRDIVLSFKSSNPKVMIAAYRLAAAKMAAEGMAYPLHLGVTEAGEGQDGRIKSAIGIGSLLYDGLGDTIRVSLTEDPWFEVPVARELAQKAENAVENAAGDGTGEHDSIDPLHYRRRETVPVELAPDVAAGGENVPRVIVPATLPLTPANVPAIADELRATYATQKDIRAEGLLVRVATAGDFAALPALADALGDAVAAVFAEVADFAAPPPPADFQWNRRQQLFVVARLGAAQEARSWAEFAQRNALGFVADIGAADVKTWESVLSKISPARLVVACSAPAAGGRRHPLGEQRALVEALKTANLSAPLWIRGTLANAIGTAGGAGDFPSRLLECSMLAGALLCDGVGDLISVEDVPSQAKSLTLAYDILQGARARVSKTEYVACPSCGRTLFDIQAAAREIRAVTGHLKGVTIAVMGCIVNGPGEMADADFGYVGGAPGKINLYVRRECVKFGIPQAEAVARLVDLIKEHGKWVEPAG